MRSKVSNGHDPQLAVFRPYLERGEVPSYRQVMRQARVGQQKTGEIRQQITVLLASAGRN
jgi:hypothetical protein